MADVAKNPFVSLSLCVASRTSSRFMLYLWQLQFLEHQFQLITLYLVFWYKYYKIWMKLSSLSRRMSKSGFLPSRLDIAQDRRLLIKIGALGWLDSLLINSPRYNVQSNTVNTGTEGGHRKCRLYQQGFVLSGSFLYSILKSKAHFLF